MSAQIFTKIINSDKSLYNVRHSYSIYRCGRSIFVFVPNRDIEIQFSFQMF